MSQALERLDDRPVSNEDVGVRAFLVVRDECERLRLTLGHHRRLGVERFFVVDNGSSDETVRYLVAQPDVHVFSTRESFQDARLGVDWSEALLNEFGEGRWCLVLDGDEQLVYPGCEGMPLPELCQQLEQQGLDCLATVFIDMYGDGPIRETRVGRASSLLEVCPYFDSSGYFGFPADDTRIPSMYGGPRARLFWPELDLASFARDAQAFFDRAFDETGYRETHADVASAVETGIVASGRDHFVRYGHHEGRRVALNDVPEWPEGTYLAIHPDVAASVRAGVLESGLEHYVRFGYFEGRLLWNDGPPRLTQVPLVRWHSGMHLDGGRHRLTGSSWRRTDAVGAALLHFRLMASLVPRTEQVLAGSLPPHDPWKRESARYRRTLAQTPRLSAMASLSVRYRESNQLVELGVVTPVAEL